jgi:hypothetical protein
MRVRIQTGGLLTWKQTARRTVRGECGVDVASTVDGVVMGGEGGSCAHKKWIKWI